MSDVLWKLDNVCLGSNRERRLEDVCVEIHPGVTALLGPSGAGKTSLLNILAGFEVPTSGVARSLVETGNDHAVPFFWVPQTHGLWPHLTALEHLRAVSGDASDGALTELLARFDLNDRMSARPSRLSHGERARLSVARALMVCARALLMDEPLASVDRARVGKYWAVIREHLTASGGSLVFSTHSPETVLAEADRVVCVRDGRLLYAGDVEALYLRPPSRELAECLGDANWLSPEEMASWLGVEGDGERCLRPEHVCVDLDAESEMMVRSARFKGSVEELDVVHRQSGAHRTWYHRPTGRRLGEGDSVRLRMVGDLSAARPCVLGHTRPLDNGV